MAKQEGVQREFVCQYTLSYDSQHEGRRTCGARRTLIMRRINPKDKDRPTRTELIADAMLNAQAETCNHGHSFIVDSYERKGAELMIPAAGSTEIMAGEAVPLPVVFRDDDNYDYSMDLTVDHVIDTLQNPDAVAVDASMTRTTILHKAGALEIGVDMAATIKARNSMEKALAHQMATCHVKAMDLMTRAADFPRGREDLEIKMLNVAARLMTVYQQGMETIVKTRNSGKQTIVVKKINIAGGQNVITDTVTGGGRHGE